MDPVELLGRYIVALNYIVTESKRGEPAIHLMLNASSNPSSRAWDPWDGIGINGPERNQRPYTVCVRSFLAPMWCGQELRSSLLVALLLLLVESKCPALVTHSSRGEHRKASEQEHHGGGGTGLLP